MRFALRVKLSVLVTLVALVPLLAATVTVVLGIRRMRLESFGQRLASVVHTEAEVLAVSLAKDIRSLEVSLNEPAVVGEVAGHDVRMSLTERMELESAWAGLPPDDPRLQAVLDNELTEVLALIRESDARVLEILITDRFGQLIAATGRTSDYYQGDEAWWTAAFARGRGVVHVPEIQYDRSTDAWALSICVPIRRDEEVVGVAKAVFDLSQWLGAPLRDVGEFSASLALLDSTGQNIYRPGAAPLEAGEQPWLTEIRRTDWPVWRVTEDGRIVGSAEVALPKRIGLFDIRAPGWRLLLHMPRSGPLGAVNRLSAITLGVGLGITALVFLLGLALVRRIVGRIRRVQLATHQVAEGDLAHRIRSWWGARRMLGRDEIDDLADDFNRMVERVQGTQAMLQAANELKSRFIKIASHELRTPVSYLLAMSSLLSRTDDPEKLRQGVQTMGERAQRLNDIIQAMFKLLPEQAYGEEVQYSTFAVSALLEEVFQVCQPFLEQRRQRLVIEGRTSTPEIQADRGKLRDVLENLVTNAIKFTPDGGTIRIRVSEQLGGHVGISVSDEGPGIPTEDLPHLFEPFYSGGDVLKHSTGEAGYLKSGMGLGLAIVRHFVHLHGGTVNVQSSEEGTTFTISIPAGAPAGRDRPESPD